MIESKVAAGSFTGIVTGLLTWALVAYVPAFRTGLPPPVAAFIPVAVGWLLSSVAAYRAPHTPRPVPASVTADQIASAHDYVKSRYGPARGDVSPQPDPPMEDLPGPMIGQPPPGAETSLTPTPPSVPHTPQGSL